MGGLTLTFSDLKFCDPDVGEAPHEHEPRSPPSQAGTVNVLVTGLCM